MSKTEDEKKTTLEQNRLPAANEKQTIKSTELTDADLGKVAGGGATPHMISNPDLLHK